MTKSVVVYNPLTSTPEQYYQLGYDVVDPFRVDEIKVENNMLIIVRDRTNPETWSQFTCTPFKILYV